MDIASFIVLARVGTYGPHIIAALGMAAFVVFMVYRLKLPLWQSTLFVIFAWQLHEFFSQIPMRIAQGTIYSYAFSFEWEIGAVLIGLGLFVLYPKMKLNPFAWTVFGLFLFMYAAVGWPVTFPPSPQVMWVGLFENAYHIYFLIPFWSLFF